MWKKEISVEGRGKPSKIAQSYIMYYITLNLLNKCFSFKDDISLFMSLNKSQIFILPTIII